MSEFLRIKSEMSEARGVEERILTEVCKCGYDECEIFAIKLALEEGLNNAIKHGNGHEISKSVEIEYDVNEKKIVVSISDEGRGYCPDDVPDPTLDENLNKPSGRGIMLIKTYMDKVSFNERGNKITMIKFRKA